jgi:hypothetical protein
MQRLYYIANDADEARRVQDALQQCGISNWNFHAIARDEAGLAVRKVHSATLYQQLDVVHSGERWAIVGAGVAFGVAALAWSLGVIPWTFSYAQLALATIVGGMFGAWQGGMVGMSRENYKIGRFHDDIDAGRVLLLVDVRAAEVQDVRTLMREDFGHVREGGSDSTFINPLASPELHAQNTH